MVDKLTSIMNMTADGDEASIRELFEDIRGSKWDETVASNFIEIIGAELNRFVIFLFHISNFCPPCSVVAWPLSHHSISPHMTI